MAGRRACLEQGRAWSEERCSCGCSLALAALPCPHGTQFDYNSTCACQSVAAASPGPAPAPRAGAGPGKGKEEDVGLDLLSWEMILIIALVSILLVLSIITLCLLVRLRALRRKVNSQQSLVPSTLSGQYFPCPDPCTDLPHKPKVSLMDIGYQIKPVLWAFIDLKKLIIQAV